MTAFTHAYNIAHVTGILHTHTDLKKKNISYAWRSGKIGRKFAAEQDTFKRPCGKSRRDDNVATVVLRSRNISTYILKLKYHKPSVRKFNETKRNGLLILFH